MTEEELQKANELKEVFEAFFDTEILQGIGAGQAKGLLNSIGPIPSGIKEKIELMKIFPTPEEYCKKTSFMPTDIVNKLVSLNKIN